MDKMKDPFGKEKAKREQERQKKIAALTGGGKTAFSNVPIIDTIAQNRPEKLPFGTLLNNVRYNGIANKPFEMINRRLENLKAQLFIVAGAPFVPHSSYHDLQFASNGQYGQSKRAFSSSTKL